MAMRGWEMFQSVVQQVGAGMAVALNALLMFVIIKASPEHIGEYKYLMMFIAGFEIVYAILDVIVQPTFHSFGATFMLIVNPKQSTWGKKVWEILATVYCGFFGSSMAIFSLHFIYRHWVIMGNKKRLKTFKGARLLIWLAIPLFNGLVWAFVGYFLCAPRKSSADYLRNNVLDTLDLNLDDIMYFAPYFYEKNENGEDDIYYPSFIGIAVDSLSINVSMSIAAYYGYQCWKNMRRLFNDERFSAQYRQIQSQLFYALVTQTLIPVVLMHFPALAMFSFAFFGQDLGSLSGIVSVTIALFPALDPFPTIFIVGNYRKAVKGYLLKVLKFFTCGSCCKCSKRSLCFFCPNRKKPKTATSSFTAI